MSQQLDVPARPAFHYGGRILVAIGLVLFISAFVTGASNFGRMELYYGPSRSEVIRLVGGAVLVIAGWVILKLGVDRLAGQAVDAKAKPRRETH
jgi:hypothetical protein